MMPPRPEQHQLPNPDRYVPLHNSQRRHVDHQFAVPVKRVHPRTQAPHAQQPNHYPAESGNHRHRLTFPGPPP